MKRNCVVLAIGWALGGFASAGELASPGATASGWQAIAIGAGAQASRDGAIGIGTGARADGWHGIALGLGAATSVGEVGIVREIAIGDGAGTSSNDATALGTNARVLGGNAYGAMALGNGATVSAGAFEASAIGYAATASATRALALGVRASAGGNGSLAAGVGAQTMAFQGLSIGFGAGSAGIRAQAMGHGASAQGNDNLAIGTSASATGGHGEVAIGRDAAAADTQATAIGAGAAAKYVDSVALGAGSATGANAPTGTGFGTGEAAPRSEVSVGSSSASRRITHLADGSTATDAVNVRQLASVATRVNAVVGQDVFDPLTGMAGTATFAVQGRRFGNLTAAINALDSGLGASLDAAAATDAINAQQFRRLTSSLGGLDGSIRNLNDAVQGLGREGGVYMRVLSSGPAAQASGVDALAIGAGSRATGEGAVALGVDARASSGSGVALGAGSVADRAGMGGASEAVSRVAVASARGAVSVGSEGAERQITHVAGATAATDAVNLRQLQAVQAGAVAYDRHADGTTNHGSITLGDGQAPGGTVVSNVAPGVAGTDAVNVDQLGSVQSATQARIDAVNTRLDGVARNAYAGVASAMAIQMPGSTVPGKTVMRIGTAVFKGESAVGVSFRRTARDGAWSLTGGVGLSRVGAAATVGAECVFD